MREVFWLGLALTLVGWVWGSFLNQVVDRTPRRSGDAGGGDGSGAPTSAAQPFMQPVTLLRPMRSICFACGAAIPWYENIPLLSFLLLRGACRRCGAAIGLRTLLMELTVPAAFAGLYGLRTSQAVFLGKSPWPALLDFLLLSLLLSWLLLAVVLLGERRRLRKELLLIGAALALAWLLLPGGI